MKRPLLDQEWSKALAVALSRYEPTPIYAQLCEEWTHDPLSVSFRADMAGA